MKFYANPYNTDATGFYFETYSEYKENVKTAKDSFGNPVEEFEFQVIDGSKEECQLVEAIGIYQWNIEEVIDFIDGYGCNECDWPAVFFLLDNKICGNLEDAKNQARNYNVSKENLLDAATKIFDECYLCLIPKASRQFIEQYIDYDKFANDCEKNGDMVEFEFGLKTYTCTNANQNSNR